MFVVEVVITVFILEETHHWKPQSSESMTYVKQVVSWQLSRVFPEVVRNLAFQNVGFTLQWCLSAREGQPLIV